MAQIDEKSKISLYAVAGSLPFIVGAVIWMTSIDAKARSADEEIKTVRSILLKIVRSQARIEQKLKIQQHKDDE